MTLARACRLAFLLFIAADLCSPATPGVFFFERDALFEQALTRPDDLDQLGVPGPGAGPADVQRATDDADAVRSVAAAVSERTHVRAAWLAPRPGPAPRHAPPAHPSDDDLPDAR